MARTRAHRRRQSLRVAVALLVTLLVVVFGHEVSRSAHLENSARLSEDLSFAQLATTLINHENTFDFQLNQLLTSGAQLSRVDFALRLSELAQDLTFWREVATQMKTPVLTPSLNVLLSNDTLMRVNDYDNLLSYIAVALALPVPVNALAPRSLGEVQKSLLSTAANWGEARHQLAHSPGHVTLSPLTNLSAVLNMPQVVNALAATPSVAISRAIEISAIEVQPAPFPAPAQDLVLAPTNSVQVQVSISNLREISQPVSLVMTFTPSTGSSQQVTQTQTLSALTSFAFPRHIFSVFPGERGTLSVTLNAVPSSAQLLHNRTYRVSVSTSGPG